MMKTIFTLFLLASLSYGQGSGTALTFNGSSTGVAVPNATELNFGLNDFTIEFWLKVPPTTVQRAIFSKRNACAASTVFWDFRLASTGAISFEVRNSTQIANVTSAVSVADGEWHHIAVKRTGNTSFFYLDGVVVNTRVATGGTPTVTNSSALRLGYSPCVGLDGTNYLIGAIDEIRIWGRGLTDAEVRTTMCQKLTGTELGLVAYYRMDEGGDNSCSGGQDVCDASGNDNHGTKF